MSRVVRFALIVTSDRVYRGEREDKITPMVGRKLDENNLPLVFSAIAPNNLVIIRRLLLSAVARADVVLVTGGTGPGPRDLSIEAVKLVATKELPGIGEIFRGRSLKKVGLKGALSRSGAFVVGSSVVFVSPGSPDAVEDMLDIAINLGPHIVSNLRGASKWENKCS